MDAYTCKLKRDWYILSLCLILCFPQGLVAQCNITIETPDDITVCGPQNVNLDGSITGNYIGFDWSGTNGFFNDTQISPSSFVSETTTFTLTGYGLLTTDLITNGDFENGNSDFTSDYMLVGPGSPDCYDEGFLDCEGTYAVINNPNDGHNNFDPCGDHTSGSGLMMVVNGAPSFQQIWCQDVDVTGGEFYVFTAWATSVNPSSPAILQFSIDGQLIGNNFTLSGSTCDWEQFYAVWQAPSSGTLEICVTNQNTSTGGNDFAIDDISFFEACEEMSSFTVTVVEFDAEFSNPELLDCNVSSTDIIATVSPSGNYDFEWTTNDGNIISPIDGQDISVDQAGEYTVIITDEFGCEQIFLLEVEADFTTPEPVIWGPDELDCQTPEIELEVIFSASNFTIVWFDENNNVIGDDPFITITSAGNYSVEVTDLDNGCSGIDDFNITISDDSPTVNLIIDEALSCSNPDANLIATATEPASYYYWTLPDGTIIEGDNLDILPINEAGLYLITIETINGCMSSAQLLVESMASEIETIFVIPTLDCNNTAVTLRTGNIDAYTSINWIDLNGITIEEDVLEVDEPGTYYFSAIDTAGCMTIVPVLVEQDITEPEASVSNGILTCSLNQLDLQPIFYTSYQEVLWTLPDGMIINQDSLTVSEAGTYLMEVVGENGCNAIYPAEVSLLNDITDVNISSTNIDCTNSTAEINLDLMSDSPYTISWTFESNIFSMSENLTVSNSGIYYLNILTDNGCIHVDSVIIADLSNPTPINIQADSDVINCAFPEVTLSLDDSDLTFLEWTLPDLSVTQNNPLVTNEPGLYMVSTVDINGCSSQSNYEITAQFTDPFFTVSSDVIDCNNPEAQLTFNSADNLDYFFADTLIDPLNFSLPLGTHEFIGQDQNGCSAIVTYEMPADTILPEIMINVGDITCLNPEAELSATLHEEILSYNWFNLLGQLITQGANAGISEPGSYILIAVGSNGCTETYEFEVKENIDEPVFDLDVLDFSCLNDNAGFILDFDTGNNSIEWEYQNQMINGLDTLFVTDEGIYEFVITDLMNGCQSDSSINLRDNRILIDSINFTSNANCGEPFGEIDLNEIIGGTPEFEVRINDALISGNSSQIENGISLINIIDSEGCELDTFVEIDLISPLIITDIPDQSVSWPTEVMLELETNRDEMDILSISWTPVNVFDCQNCFVQLFVPERSLDLHIAVADVFGCEAKIDVRIDLDKNIDIYFPNVFSPNNDSENDLFFGYGNLEQIKTVNSLQIFDRWGNEVFSKTQFSLNDPASGWNGDFNNQSANQGVYTYIAFVELVNGETLKFVGDLTLLD